MRPHVLIMFQQPTHLSVLNAPFVLWFAHTYQQVIQCTSSSSISETPLRRSRAQCNLVSCACACTPLPHGCECPSEARMMTRVAICAFCCAQPKVAFNAGTQLCFECGAAQVDALASAISNNKTSVSQLDSALARMFTTRMRLGEFDVEHPCVHLLASLIYPHFFSQSSCCSLSRACCRSRDFRIAQCSDALPLMTATPIRPIYTRRTPSNTQ